MADQRRRVEVSPSCIGAGLCIAIAPAHFVFEGARAKSTAAAIDTAEDADLVRTAAEVCPALAISVSD